MSCGSDFLTSNCVCDTLLAIVEAQDRVNPTNDCAFGCSRAIQELVGGVVSGNFNTIPVMLICKNTCAPFVGAGVRRGTGTPPPIIYETIVGIVFRVIDVDPETCCASLEILDIVNAAGNPVVSPTNVQNPGAFLDALDAPNNRLRATGVCITVDLNCFCGVSCLFPHTFA